MPEIFSETARDPSCRARTGILSLPHGDVKTPVFMPVGTNATVKAMTKEMLEEMGFNLILANTYHVYLRPGEAVVGEAGGLHGFTKWKGNFLTDSGGYQVFSLAPFRKITDDGVKFRSHIDGSLHFLTPESVVDVQMTLQSDILMQLDVCTEHGASRKESEKALTLTTAWAKRCRNRWLETRERNPGHLFCILQGNFFKDLRERHAEEMLSLDWPGVAVGGLSVGEPFEVFTEFVAHSGGLLPPSKPHYLMGIGTPEYILEAVEHGIDMFDCVFPTRTARNGLLFTNKGPISIKKAAYERDFGPVDPECRCRICQTYSRSYLRHLYKSQEILYSILATHHNLQFLKDFVDAIGVSISNGAFLPFKESFLARYGENKAEKG